MKSNPLFSIITVTYNAADYLEATIQSIIQQKENREIEYIIIDGGSTDKTLEIIKKYESYISYWISEPDKGLYDAMNKGLARAKGLYVWFINAGDRLYSLDTTSNIIEKIKDSSPDIIYGETAIIDKDGHFLHMRRLKAPEKLSWKSFRWGMLVCHQSFIVKKEIAPFYDLQYALVADYDWCIQCLKKAKTIFNSHLILSNFMEAGLSARNRKNSLKERFEVMKKYYGWVSTASLHLWFAVRYFYARWINKKV